MTLKKFSYLILKIAVLAIFSSSCTPAIRFTQTTLNLGADQKWSLKSHLFIQQLEDAYIKAAFIDILNQTLSDAQSLGVEGKWRELKNGDGFPGIEITLRGKGYDVLNELVFDGHPVVQITADNQVSFKYDPPGSIFVTGLFTLKAGSIISTNGNLGFSQPITVWDYPIDHMEAVVSISPTISSNLIILLLCIVVMGVIGTLVGASILIFSKKPSQRRQQAPGNSAFPVPTCKNCGNQIPPQSQFCPYCGGKTT